MRTLGNAGLQRFRIELERFPGIRSGILQRRFDGAVPFTYYPSMISGHDFGERDGLYDPRIRGKTAAESVHLNACFEFIQDFLRRSRDRHLLVQSDYRRLGRRNCDSMVATGAGEQLLIIDNGPELYGSPYQVEVWVDLFERSPSQDDIDITINRGMLHPRALGILCELEGAPARHISCNDIIDGAHYLVYDAFDGQWLIFAALRSKKRR